MEKTTPEKLTTSNVWRYAVNWQITRGRCDRRLLVVAAVHVVQQVNNTSTVAVLVVIPVTHKTRTLSSQFLADRTNGRAYATVLRLSVCRLSVCDVMYCG